MEVFLEYLYFQRLDTRVFQRKTRGTRRYFSNDGDAHFIYKTQPKLYTLLRDTIVLAQFFKSARLNALAWHALHAHLEAPGIAITYTPAVNDPRLSKKIWDAVQSFFFESSGYDTKLDDELREMLASLVIKYDLISDLVRDEQDIGVLGTNMQLQKVLGVVKGQVLHWLAEEDAKRGQTEEVDAVTRMMADVDMDGEMMAEE